MPDNKEKYCKNCLRFIPLDVRKVIEEDVIEVKRRRICGVSWFFREIVPIEGSKCVNPKEYKEPGKWN